MIVGTARDAADLVEPLFAGSEGEKLAILHLDGKRALIALEEYGVDPGKAAGLPVRTIIDAALRLGAEGMVVAHNRPAADADPSATDIAATRMVAEAAANLGIQLHDHLIFAGGRCRSYRELGLL
ncbi:MAG TPA: JAB domain-containing protein [Allosphingosinicella sp.]|nr:JAB domain-containing protein [Allosphingosinicella sp.]